MVVLAVAGCSRDIAPPGGDSAGPDAYLAVLDEFVPPADVDDPPAVFVVSLGEPLSLDDQVAIIDGLDDGRDVEFVDDPRVVIDDEREDRVSSDSAVLIGVGTIPSEPPYTVRVEVYRSENDVEGRLVTLVPSAGGWAVTASEMVLPEVLAHEQ